MQHPLGQTLMPAYLHFKLNLAVCFIPVQDVQFAFFLLGIQGKLEGVFHPQFYGMQQIKLKLVIKGLV